MSWVWNVLGKECPSMECPGYRMSLYGMPWVLIMSLYGMPWVWNVLVWNALGIKCPCMECPGY